MTSQKQKKKQKVFKKINDSYRKKVFENDRNEKREEILSKMEERVLKTLKQESSFSSSFSKKYEDDAKSLLLVYIQSHNSSNRVRFLWLFAQKNQDGWFYLIPMETIEKLIDGGQA